MCQLEHIDELGQENSWLNDRLQFSIKKFRYYRRSIRQRLQPVDVSKMLYFKPEPVQPGDRVRVRSEAEIKQTLNGWRKTKGCTFQIGMYAFCGKEFEVFKKVDYFFDEARQKICKCNNIYLLKGACCDGSTAYLEPCNRQCFFFWQSSWFEKL